MSPVLNNIYFETFPNMKSKSPYLAIRISDHDVVRLEVPVDDAGAVHEADGGDDLGEEELHPDVLHLVQELAGQVNILPIEQKC